MTANRATISVVITSYNYADFVGTAIESALKQTRPPDEVVVVDDGSTDRSREVIASFGAAVKAVFKQNEGNKVTVNRGYQESSGSIVLFLDADDALYPDALRRIEEACKPGIVAVQYDLDIIDGGGNLLGRRFCNFGSSTSPDEIAAQFARTGTYVWPVTSGNAYDRSFLERVMPLIPPVSHDGVLNTIAPLYGRVARISEPLGQYRLHSRNLSTTDGRGGFGRHPDFARAIRIRREEFEILAEHARKLGNVLPRGYLLDNELVFVNYRLMAMRIGQQYPGAADDSAVRLWRRGVALALGGEYRSKAKLAHVVWLTALLLSPRMVARQLLALRFGRAELLQSFRAMLGRARRAG